MSITEGLESMDTTDLGLSFSGSVNMPETSSISDADTFSDISFEVAQARSTAEICNQYEGKGTIGRVLMQARGDTALCKGFNAQAPNNIPNLTTNKGLCSGGDTRTVPGKGPQTCIPGKGWRKTR